MTFYQNTSFQCFLVSKFDVENDGNIFFAVLEKKIFNIRNSVSCCILHMKMPSRVLRICLHVMIRFEAVRRPGIEPRTTAWKAAMLTIDS